MAGRRLDRAFGNVRHDRRDDRITELTRDPLGQRLDPCVVLAERHVRPVLLGAADGQEHGRLAGADESPKLGPRQILEQDRIRGLCVGRRGQSQGETERRQA